LRSAKEQRIASEGPWKVGLLGLKPTTEEDEKEKTRSDNNFKREEEKAKREDRG